MGDHVYRKDEMFGIFERTDDVLRPANFPPESPGAELVAASRRAMGRPSPCSPCSGRTYMRPVDCPFRAADRILDGSAPARVDHRGRPRRGDQRQAAPGPLPRRPGLGRARHAHARRHGRRADPPGRHGYQTDVGMTGPHDSILGRRYDRVLAATLTFVPPLLRRRHRRPPAQRGPAEIDPQTGHALTIGRVSINQAEAQRLLTDSSEDRRES